ncbi:MAG: helix-turn-helix domain-containing protein [Acutalibacteraceae bacterium]
MEQWIANVVGKMHINKITQTELAKKMGVTNDYIWMILNGKKTPKGAETRINDAIDSILAERNG